MGPVKNFFDERFAPAFMDSEWLPRGGGSLENELSGYFDLGVVYCSVHRLIKITVLYLLTTVLYLLYSTLDILWKIQ